MEEKNCVPENWEVKEIGELCVINPPKPICEPNTEVSFIAMADVSDNAKIINQKTAKFDSVKSGFTSFSEGDILVAKITPCFENGKGAKALGLKNKIGFGSTEFHVLKPKDGVSQSYIYYITVSPEFRRGGASKMTGSAGQQRVPKGFIEDYKISIPKEFSEQEKIAEVITTIDQAIEKTENLIAKYERIKTGLMQDLLTRGIDEQGRMRSEETHKFKDSPLGRIPVEWEVISFEHVSEKILVGIATSSSNSFTTEENGVLFLRNQNIKPNKIDLVDIAYITHSFALSYKSKFIKEGDILTVRTGYPGISAVVPKVLENSQTFTTLITRLNQEVVLPKFATTWLNSNFGKVQIKNLQGGGAQQNLNAGALKKIMLKKPSLNEQRLIIQTIDSCEELIENGKEKLSKHQKMKISLMQDLLTGKVRVDALIN